MNIEKVSPSPTRRNMLTGALAATAALAVLPAATAPDQELAAIAQEAAPLAALFTRNLQAFFTPADDSPDLERVADMNTEPAARLDALTDRALELEARTMAGFVAKAHLYRHHLMMQYGVGGVFVPDDLEAEIGMSLANDLLKWGAVA